MGKVVPRRNNGAGVLSPSRRRPCGEADERPAMSPRGSEDPVRWGARGDAVTTEVPVSLWSFLSSRFVSVMVSFALSLLWVAWRWCSDVPAAAVGRIGCMYRSSWCLECCEASPAVDPLLLRWSLPTLDRSLPVRKITRSPQGHGSFVCEAAAAAAARLRLVSAVVSAVCWSKDLSVISFTVEVFCTAGESSI